MRKNTVWLVALLGLWLSTGYCQLNLQATTVVIKKYYDKTIYEHAYGAIDTCWIGQAGYILQRDNKVEFSREAELYWKVSFETYLYLTGSLTIYTSLAEDPLMFPQGSWTECVEKAEQMLAIIKTDPWCEIRESNGFPLYKIRKE